MFMLRIHVHVNSQCTWTCTWTACRTYIYDTDDIDETDIDMGRRSRDKEHVSWEMEHGHGTWNIEHGTWNMAIGQIECRNADAGK
jgi:hypothetical protein